jgi:Uma2 family endonuclease
VAEYHRLVDDGILDGQPVELLNGKLVVRPREGVPHASTSTAAGEYLVLLLGEHAQVRRAKPITLSAVDSEPEPDLAIVERLGREYRDHHPYPENVFWLIEYANTSLSKDLDQKKRVYADAGIPEYWVVNLRDMTVLVFREPDAGTYRYERNLDSGVIHPLAIPDAAVSVDRLL